MNINENDQTGFAAYTDEDWAEHDAAIAADMAAADADEYDYGYGFDNPVDMGYYDDDPSPYAGDYSEM